MNTLKLLPLLWISRVVFHPFEVRKGKKKVWLPKSSLPSPMPQKIQSNPTCLPLINSSLTVSRTKERHEVTQEPSNKFNSLVCKKTMQPVGVVTQEPTLTPQHHKGRHASIPQELATASTIKKQSRVGMELKDATQ